MNAVVDAMELASERPAAGLLGLAERRLVPDPERIVNRVADEFGKLLMLVLLEPPECLGDPDLVEAHAAFHWAMA